MTPIKNKLYIETYRNKQGQFGWRMKRGCRTVACGGETYKRLKTMLRVLNGILDCIQTDQYVYEVKEHSTP